MADTFRQLQDYLSSGEATDVKVGGVTAGDSLTKLSAVTALILNMAKTNIVNIFSVAQKGSVATVSYAANLALDMNASNNFEVLLTGNMVLDNPTGISTNQMQGGIIKLVQDVTGGRTLTLGTNWKLIGTDDADTGSVKTNIYQYTVIDSTNILIQFVKTL